jgi:arylsulfatase
MLQLSHRFVQTNGIRMHIAEAGSGPLVLLLHGFPECWYSWRHQLQALADAGYHAVAPDLRGYGQTDRPDPVEQYTQQELVADVVGLIDVLDEEQAVVIGHDWGAPVAWNTAVIHPDRVRGVIGLSVPYTPRGPQNPLTLMRSFLGEGFYIVYFQKTGVADTEMARDVRTTFLRLLYSVSGDCPGAGEEPPVVPEGKTFVEALQEPASLPAWLTQSDLDYYVAEFERTGFTGGLNWLRTIDLSWEQMAAYQGAHVQPPALYIAGDRDHVPHFPGMNMLLPRLKSLIPNLRQTLMLPGCGHWTQQERPSDVNAAILEFLGGLEPPRATPSLNGVAKPVPAPEIPQSNRSHTIVPPPTDPPFAGSIGTIVSDSTPAWPERPRPASHAPNVMFIVLDDIGFAQLGCYGGAIETPNIDRLAAGGLRYTRWCTTTLCSPTRACLLTGRNAHSVGMGVVSEAATGFPGYNASIPRSAGMLPEMLRAHGYATLAVGKWHLTPLDEVNNVAASRENWPLGRGFDRFYGFLGGETNQWYPDLVHDNHMVDPPRTPEQGYHLSEDLADRAIEYLRDARQVDPDKPFFLYWCPGAGHAPHHVASQWADRYKGKFDQGWDQLRADTLARQKQLGLVPESTEYGPLNPLGDQESEPAVAWDELSEAERRLCARQMEVYAGFISHLDQQIGRLIDFLETSGQLDNTLLFVVSDNGASGEGGRLGSVNEFLFFNRVPERLDAALAHLEDWGGPGTYPHYAYEWAMAGNTPMRRWKRYVYSGGISDPCIVHWPARMAARGGLRTQYHHAIDVLPTVLEALGIEAPTMLNGVAQKPIEGVSMLYTWEAEKAPTHKKVQYYEALGGRAIWADGWKAVTGHQPAADTGDFANDVWELFRTDVDPGETLNLADEHPAKLQELIQLWWSEAGRHNVLPLDDRAQQRLGQLGQGRSRIVLYPGTAAVPGVVAPRVLNRGHTITADVEIPSSGAAGVLVSHGSRFGGYALFVQDGYLTYVHNYLGLNEFTLRSSAPVPTGAATIRFEFNVTGFPDIDQGRGTPGHARLLINNQVVGEMDLPYTVMVSFDQNQGLTAGRGGPLPVTSTYADAFPFSGTLKQVVLEVQPSPLPPMSPADLQKLIAAQRQMAAAQQ